MRLHGNVIQIQPNETFQCIQTDKIHGNLKASILFLLRFHLFVFVTAKIPLYQILSSLNFSFRASAQCFKMCLLGESFHNTINGGLFSSQPIWTSHFLKIYLKWKNIDVHNSTNTISFDLLCIVFSLTIIKYIY